MISPRVHTGVHKGISFLPHVFSAFYGGIDVSLNSDPTVRNWPFFNAFF